MTTVEALPVAHPLAELQALVIQAEAAQSIADRLWKRVTELACDLNVVVAVYPQGS